MERYQRNIYYEPEMRKVQKTTEELVSESKKLRRMKNGGKVVLPTLESRTLETIISDPGFMILPYHVHDGGYNEIYFLRIYGAKYEVLFRLRIKRIERTEPIRDGKIFKSVYTYGSVRCSLLLESRSYHLVYYSNKFSGLLLENKSISTKEEAEIYGHFEIDSRSLVVYGWDVCIELRINH